MTETPTDRATYEGVRDLVILTPDEALRALSAILHRGGLFSSIAVNGFVRERTPGDGRPAGALELDRLICNAIRDVLIDWKDRPEAEVVDFAGWKQANLSDPTT